MKIVYKGRSASGRLIPVGNQSIHAKKGEPVEVPDNIAIDLIAGSDWEKAEADSAGKVEE